MIDEKLIELCKLDDRIAQKQVFDQLSGKLFFTCKRYLKREDLAEDVLLDAFQTIFSKIHQLKETKAFEGWARQITVNKCLHMLRKEVNFNLHLTDESVVNEQIAAEPESSLEHEDLLNLVEQLPSGCKTVFNLYAIEGFTHQEIATKLNVSEGTSKSQLSFARKKLQALVLNFFYLKSDVR